MSNDEPVQWRKVKGGDGEGWGLFYKGFGGQISDV